MPPKKVTYRNRIVSTAPNPGGRSHHFRLGIVRPVGQEPLEIAPMASLPHDVATSPGAIALFAEPAPLVRDETNAAVAFRI
jgi:hypothetical protein